MHVDGLPGGYAASLKSNPGSSSLIRGDAGAILLVKYFLENKLLYLRNGEHSRL
jgi:hypothetical protein